MNPARSFDEISSEILKKCKEDDIMTIGVLLADGQQDEAREYILNYMDRFDKKSGKYIDFYIPGYYEKYSGINGDISRKYHPNAYVKWEEVKEKPIFHIHRNQTAYYFDRDLFETFIDEMEQRMEIEYTYNPMLILVEVNKKKKRGDIEFQNRLVIELDEDSNRGLRRTGQLFDKIFEIARKEDNLDGIGADVTRYYIKGKAVDSIINILNGNYIQAVAGVVGDIKRFRIRTVD